MTFEELREFMLVAHNRFHDLLPGLAARHPGMASFSTMERFDLLHGRGILKHSVAPLLCEMTNRINDWSQQLHIWSAWQHVLSGMAEEQRWELESIVVEPVAFFCMLQPATNSDRMLEIVEALLHQANLIVVDGYVDRLDQDSPKKNGRRLNRHEALAQLDRLGKGWESYQRFKDLHRLINAKDYRRLSADFRNRAVHSVSSRWTQGDIISITRSVVPWEDLVDGPDGIRFVPHPTRKAVQYEVGVRMPLDMGKMHALNLKQYRLVRKTLAALDALVAEAVSAVNAKPPFKSDPIA